MYKQFAEALTSARKMHQTKNISDEAYTKGQAELICFAFSGVHGGILHHKKMVNQVAAFISGKVDVFEDIPIKWSSEVLADIAKGTRSPQTGAPRR